MANGRRPWHSTLALLVVLPTVGLSIWAIQVLGSTGEAARDSGSSAPSEPADPAYLSSSTRPRVIYVDAEDEVASDRSPGTRERPLETIAEAAKRALARYRRGLATEVSIGSGTYRESVRLTGPPHATGGSILFRGSDRTLISGSEIWTHWRRAAGTELYIHDWPFEWGLSSIPEAWQSTYAADDLEAHPIIRRSEMVFVDGLPLRQELSIDDAAATRGAFYVAEDQARIYVSPPKGADMERAVVEVSVRPSLLTVRHVDNIGVSNITFQHAASTIEAKAVSFVEGDGISVIRCRFLWNNWLGLGVSNSSDVTIRDSTANHNGVGGMSGYWIGGLLVEDSETSYNNWRGSRGISLDPSSPLDGSFIDFATGQKFFRLRDAVFRNFRSVGNLTGGLWLDWDNERVRLVGLDMRRNLTHGVFIEASQGPVTITGGEFCGNETGVLIANSEGGTVENSVFGGNSLAQIYIAGDPDGSRTVENRDTGEQEELITRDWTLVDNLVMTENGGLAQGTYLGTTVWDNYVATLDSDRNMYLYESSAAIFQVSGGNTLDLEEWQSHSGGDTTSLAEAGTRSCTLEASAG